MGLQLCSGIWLGTVIGMLKMPFSFCPSMDFPEQGYRHCFTDFTYRGWLCLGCKLYSCVLSLKFKAVLLVGSVLSSPFPKKELLFFSFQVVTWSEACGPALVRVLYYKFSPPQKRRSFTIKQTSVKIWHNRHISLPLHLICLLFTFLWPVHYPALYTLNLILNLFFAYLKECPLLLYMYTKQQSNKRNQTTLFTWSYSNTLRFFVSENQPFKTALLHCFLR